MPTRAPEKSLPEPWRSFLGELDAAVETEVRLDCMGGFNAEFSFMLSPDSDPAVFNQVETPFASHKRVAFSMAIT